MFFIEEIFQITALSLQISGIATAISLLLGLPLGTLLALGKFPGRSLLLSLINTGMGLPPVVVGLFVAMMLWRSGPLGDLRLIYTPTAIVIAQVVIAFPVVASRSAGVWRPDSKAAQAASMRAPRARISAMSPSRRSSSRSRRSHSDRRFPRRSGAGWVRSTPM